MISQVVTHSPLDSCDTEQVTNPWISRKDLSPSTATNRPRGDPDSAFRDDVVWQDHISMIISPSTPPPPSATQPSPAQPPMQDTDPTPADPRIASLKAIFPDFDDAVILSVLESTHDDNDRALDVLLGMNDPSFVPPNPPPAQPPSQFQPAPSPDAQRLSQEALDEQLARRLALEEQNAASQAWQPQGAPVEGQTVYQPYQARRGGRSGWGGPPQGPPQTQGQGGRDTMTEFQDGFNRIAESGKKTFSSIFSKVKAKVQEFDQGSGWSWTQNPPPAGQGSQPASGSYYTPDQRRDSVQGAYAQPYQQPANLQRQTSQSQPAPVSTYTSSPPRSGISRSSTTEPATAQQPSYYDPNTQGYDLYGDEEDEIELHDRRTPSNAPAPATQSPPTTTTTTPPQQPDSSATPPPPSDTSSPPSYASPVSSPPPSASVHGSVSTGVSPPARAGTFPPTMAMAASSRGTKPGAPGGVDFSKLGLLPKRPVSLVRSQSPSATGAGAAGPVSAPRVAIAHSTSTADSSTDYEEAEFVENPFEDR